MAYPRRCPCCGTRYDGDGRGGPAQGLDLHHTVVSEPGGTPSPWRPDVPDRLLTLTCLLCGGEYVWDFFGDAVVSAGGARRRARKSPPVYRRGLTLSQS